MSNQLHKKIAFIICAAFIPISAQTAEYHAPLDTIKDTGNTSTLSPPGPSEATAYKWAIGGTILGAPVFGVGLIVGPSIGQFYAGSPVQGTIGIVARTVGIGLAWVGLEDAVTLLSNGGNFSNERVDRLNNAANEFLTAGLVVWAAGTIYSFVDTHYAVKRAHEKSKAVSAARFDLSPILTRNSDGSQRAGMMARLSL